MTKVAIIANCQARPIATLCRWIAPQVEISGVGIIHLATPQDEMQIAASCAAADVILAQFVQDNYPVPFVRTGVLKEKFSGKVLIWPNLFFRGQCPDLFYATGEGHRRLIGPLAEYHLRSILEAWRNGVAAAETARRFEQDDIAVPTDSGLASLRDLRNREAACDVQASDLIAEAWRHERLFFTFNHPRMRLLEAVCRQLLAASGIAAPGDLPPHFGEPLGGIVPPMTRMMQKAAGLDFAGQEEQVRGVPFPESTGRAIGYSLPALTEAFYRAYDAQSDLARSARLS